ncbi:MAG TPA: hypothetical protein VES68_02790 [Candidatus Sulfotelmatobacter sp.]|nr:hypothetical protein [Candidatus Sulfotelmatobacter sp.]
MRRSRLNKNTEKKTKKTITLSVIGILIVLFILFRFGLEFLVNFSLFLSGSKNQVSTNTSNNINFINPPILNNLPNATNSAEIIIAGKSDKNTNVLLYINSKNVDDILVNKDGLFVFRENLNPGDNQIKVRAQLSDKKSDYSDTLDILYKNSQPSLDVNSPSDGQTFKKDQNSANVSGKTDPGVSVTVNGFWAVIDDNNNFSYSLPLQNGDNEIKIVAVDQAGNKTEKDIRVNYSQ